MIRFFLMVDSLNLCFFPSTRSPLLMNCTSVPLTFSTVSKVACGHMDSNATLSDLKAVLKREGVHVHMNAKVTKFNVSADGSKVSGLSVATGVATTEVGGYEKRNIPKVDHVFDLSQHGQMCAFIT